MIVVDSSVFVADLRDEPTAATRFMRALEAEHELIIGDLVALEVLQGMDDERKSALLEDALVNYGLTAMLDEAVAIASARNFRQLRRRGITLRKTPDLIIATFCMVHGHHLLHQDRDFDHFEKLLGLKVFRPH